MKKFNSFILLCVVLLFAGCTQWTDSDLVGTWEAISITEEGEPLSVDYPTVLLTLKADNTYEYKGTLNYREAGKWLAESNYLYTKDTLKPDGVQKIVFIADFQQDSIEMQMVEQEKTRFMKMKRVTRQ
jgi:hypothetical protein